MEPILPQVEMTIAYTSEVLKPKKKSPALLSIQLQ